MANFKVRMSHDSIDEAIRSLEAFKKDIPNFLTDEAKKIGQRGVRRARKLTPVGVAPTLPHMDPEEYARHWSSYRGGRLRRGWKSEVIYGARGPMVRIYNPVEYASYVEYGHRQTPGRYVPALGLSLTSSWVPGQFMLKDTINSLRADIPGILQRDTDRIIRKALAGSYKPAGGEPGND